MTEAQKRAHRKAYLEKVSEHRCVVCGESDERTRSGRVRCAACFARQYQYPPKPKSDEQRARAAANKAAWKGLLRENKCCIYCGEKDAYTINGRALCAVCAKRSAAGRRKRYSENPEPYRERARELRQKWDEAGLCTICGKKPQDLSYKTCVDCRVRARMKMRKRRAKKKGESAFMRGQFGKCWQCNREMAMEGKRMCPKCYERFMENMRRGRAEKAKRMSDGGAEE